MTRAETQSRRENKNPSLPLCGSAPLREILLDSGPSLRCDVCALGENMSFLLQTPIRYSTKHSAAAFLLFACACLDPLTAYGWGALASGTVAGNRVICSLDQAPQDVLAVGPALARDAQILGMVHDLQVAAAGKKTVVGDDAEAAEVLPKVCPRNTRKGAKRGQAGGKRRLRIHAEGKQTHNNHEKCNGRKHICFASPCQRQLAPEQPAEHDDWGWLAHAANSIRG